MSKAVKHYQVSLFVLCHHPNAKFEKSNATQRCVLKYSAAAVLTASITAFHCKQVWNTPPPLGIWHGNSIISIVVRAVKVCLISHRCRCSPSRRRSPFLTRTFEIRPRVCCRRPSLWICSCPTTPAAAANGRSLDEDFLTYYVSATEYCSFQKALETDTAGPSIGYIVWGVQDISNILIATSAAFLCFRTLACMTN